MPDFEYMARLPEGGPHTAPNATFPIWVTESDLQGMTALAHWLAGFEAGEAGLRVGRVPGRSDFTMFLRRVNDGIRKAAQPKATDESQEGRK